MLLKENSVCAEASSVLLGDRDNWGKAQDLTNKAFYGLTLAMLPGIFLSLITGHLDSCPFLTCHLPPSPAGTLSTW